VNAAFLRRLAAAGGGLCELVESEDRLDAVMAKVHRRIGTPIATELAVRGEGLELDAAAITPRKLPDVYAGAPVTILGRYRGRAGQGAAIELTGTTLGEPLRTTIAREPVADPAPWLTASWARATIRDLEDQYAAGARGELEAQIVALSKRHGVLSRFTAFLAVDRSQVVNAGGPIHQLVQPVETPAGWQQAPGGGNVRSRGGLVGAVNRAVMPPSAPASLPSAPPPLGAPPTIYAAAAAPRMAAGGKVSAPMAPLGGPALPPSPPVPGPMSREAPRSHAATPPPVDAYLASLTTLARELEAQARGRCDLAALRVLRLRLTEWSEDVRSVGGHDELAAAVEHQVQRLAAAITLGTGVATEALAVATELAALASGTPPPANRGRLAFWK
jgi:Ca-activated chloride channel family protein